MPIDPGWTKVAATSGFGRTSVTPRDLWTVLVPVADGNMDVDFVITVSSQYPTFSVRSDDPVLITSTPMRTP